nr:hypothetical protein [Tanacetum cinerariifolium]
SPTYPLGYKAAMIRLRAKSPSTSYPLSLTTPPSRTPPLLPIPLPTSSPPLLLPSTSRRADVPEVTLPPQKRLCIDLGLRFEEEEYFRDDADDEEEDEEEEEDHPAPADSVSPPVYRVMPRIYVRAQTPISLPSETKERLKREYHSIRQKNTKTNTEFMQRCNAPLRKEDVTS